MSRGAARRPAIEFGQGNSPAAVPRDLDWSATLLRESREESQVRVVVDSIAYLGHQVVTGDSRVPGPYVQVRLFGLIEAFGPPAPDPDSGHVYRRLMTSIRLP